jgi:hypothetical protein
MTMDKLNNEICELTDAELEVVAGGTVSLEHEELHTSRSDDGALTCMKTGVDVAHHGRLLQTLEVEPPLHCGLK